MTLVAAQCVIKDEDKLYKMIDGLSQDQVSLFFPLPSVLFTHLSFAEEFIVVLLLPRTMRSKTWNYEITFLSLSLFVPMNPSLPFPHFFYCSIAIQLSKKLHSVLIWSCSVRQYESSLESREKERERERRTSLVPEESYGREKVTKSLYHCQSIPDKDGRTSDE